MEAHVSNETMHLLRGSTRTRLVHLIISAECLRKSGIDVDSLSRCADAGLGCRPRGPLKIRTQTRRHSDETCSSWRSCSGTYVPLGAVASVLVPGLRERRNVFSAKNVDGGGLFVSVPVECDEHNRIDPFDVLALRVSDPETVDFPRYADILFLHDELALPGTRYDADADRLQTLCAQFVAYAGKHRRSMGPWAEEIRAKMLSLLRKFAKDRGNKRVVPAPLDVRAILDFTAFDLPGSATARDSSGRPVDSEVMFLLKRAAESVTRAAPFGRGSSGARSDGRSVVSGLKQGAMAYVEESDREDAGPSGKKRVKLTAASAGLEPAGLGRFVGGTADARAVANRAINPPNAASALEDVLIFCGSDQGPESITELLKTAIFITLGGYSTEDAWRRRAISVVERAHMNTGGAPFYVLSYEASAAVGGRNPVRRANGADSSVIDSPANALALACSAANVRSPSNLPEDAKRTIADGYPGLRPLLFPDRAAGSRTTVPFSVSSEAELMARFATACSRAAVDAISAAVRSKPKLPQSVSYELDQHDERYLEILTARVPHLIMACASAIIQASLSSFPWSALASATLAFMAKRDTYQGRVWYGTGNDACEPAGMYADFTSPVERADSCFVFDYYSSAGECVKVSKRPIPVVFDAGRCAFPSWFSNLRREAACENYLPGESYAYACVGYDSDLKVAVVLPGGFVLRADASEYFAWEGQAAGVLERTFADRRPDL